ncbi:apolipoprotein Eb [Scomber scombrus]|uniref:Apolipoprotein Eb n=1 Tax=Scomber scombrus TaxID=13677 RepID=A0AAV1NHX5_SCOSC
MNGLLLCKVCLCNYTNKNKGRTFSLETGCETFTPLFTLTARLLNHPLKTVQTGENFGRGVGGNTLRGRNKICTDKSSAPRERVRARASTSPGSTRSGSSLLGLYKNPQSHFREHGRSLTSQVSVCPTNMKALALILALAVITGCNARAVRQADATLNRWEESVDRFWQYVSELNQQADGVVQTVKTSQLTRELDTLITDTMAELTAYKEEIQTKVSPYAEASTGQLSEDLQLLATKLQKDMLDAKERSTEYLGELKTMMEQNSDDVRNRISTYTHKLKKRLNKDTEEIRNTVATYLGELQSRTSQNLDAVKDHVEPYVQQASDTATKKLGDISTILRSQAEGLGQQLETQAEGLKTQLESTAQDLRTSLEGKIDELTELLSPYATQIREQVEGIIEKVKESASA